MAYSPSGHGCGNVHISAIELEGIKSLIKKWSGLDIHLIEAGPSVNDPCGEIDRYISFRNEHGDGVAIGVTPDHIMKVTQTGFKRV